MRAIVLSAEQGKRLLPLTSETPRCLLPVRASRTLLEAQLRELAACGVTEVSVMAGFRADRVGALLDADPVPGLRAMAFYNPFFNIAGNLATCWVARSEMREDFVLVNGDTLFEAAVLERLLDSPPALVTLAVNEKSQYDPDDMKVARGRRNELVSVGKKLDPAIVDGEAIGLTLFRGEGPARFVRALDAALRDPSALYAWYPSVLNSMADDGVVFTTSITGLWWAEVDSVEDLRAVRSALGDPAANGTACGHTRF